MTVYLLPHDHKRLKQLAVEHDTTIQALVMDGLDVILKDNGQNRSPAGKPDASREGEYLISWLVFHLFRFSGEWVLSRLSGEHTFPDR